MAELNLQHDTWQDGDTWRGHFVKAGLFVYAGFGLGHYFTRSGCVVWTNVESAISLARADGVSLVGLDPLFVATGGVLNKV